MGGVGFETRWRNYNKALSEMLSLERRIEITLYNLLISIDLPKRKMPLYLNNCI